MPASRNPPRRSPAGSRIAGKTAALSAGTAGARAAETPIRILVADGQAIDRGGLVGLLSAQRGFNVVGEAASVEEAIEQCRSLRPDVLLLSLNLPSKVVGDVVTLIRTALPQARILALSERGVVNCMVLNPPGRSSRSTTPLPPCAVGADCLQLAAAQGALGTLRRSADPEELFRAVRAVSTGVAYYDAGTAAGLMTGPGRANVSQREQLSERELEVASLISDGLSNKEIATALSIGEPTVKKHVGQILAKLGLQDRLQAGLYLARNPLIFRRA